MKLLIVTSIYKRHDLSRVVLNYFSRLKSKFGYELLAVGSEGNRSRNLCEECGWNYIEYPNNPLTQKFNAIFLAAKKYNPDGIVLVGSDNLLSESLIQYYYDNFNADTEGLRGLKDAYFFSVSDQKTLYWKGHGPGGFHDNKSIGAGRFFSKKLLDILEWQPWGNKQEDRALDNWCSQNVRNEKKQMEIRFTMEQSGICVDIKTDVNVTPFSVIEGRKDLTEQVGSEILFKTFPVEFEQVMAFDKINEHITT